jgi:hypothetical protein
VKPVVGRIAKIVQGSSAIEQLEFVQRAILNVRWQLAASITSSDFFGFGIGEGADHDLRS